MNSPMRFCPHCGAAQNRPEARFCPSCGRPLSLQTRPAPPAIQQPAEPPQTLMRRRLRWLLPIALLLLVLVVALALPTTRTTWLAVLSAPTPTVVATGDRPGSDVATVSTATSEVLPATPATILVVPTATALPAATAVATATPVSTATSLPTATQAPTNTPISTPAAPEATARQAVNLRIGPDQDFDVVRLLTAGESMRLQGRTQQGDWLQVTTDDGATGWVFAQYLDKNTEGVEVLPVVTVPPLPQCRVAVDSRLSSAFTRSDLGCPVGAAQIIWAAWQPFERGALLWRDDRDQVTVLYQGAGWSTLPDQWDQVSPPPQRGTPPAGRQAPIRGFGWIWGNSEQVFNGLGWAVDQEKGVCLLVQDFERGFVLTKSSASSCSDRQGRTNYSRGAEMPPLFVAAYGAGAGWRFY